MEWGRTPEGREAILRSGSVLALAPSEWDQLLMFVRSRTLSPGEVLFAQGDPGDALAFVVEGSFSVRLRTGADEWELMRTQAGEFVGEMACFDPAPRSASVVAVTPARVMLLDRAGLAVLNEHLPRVAARITFAIIERVNARLAEIDAEIDRIVAPAPAAPMPTATRSPSSSPPPRTASPSSPPPRTASPSSPPPHRSAAPSSPPPRTASPTPPKPDHDDPASAIPRAGTPSGWWRAIVQRVQGET